MKKFFIKIFLVSFFIYPAFALAINEDAIKANIIVSKSFRAGEVMQFNYEIISQEKISIKYIPSIECGDNIPQEFPELMKADLAKNIAHKGSYSGVQVVPEFPGQECKAVISIIEPYEKKFTESFLIATKPKLDMDFIFCENQACGKEQKTFAVNSPVFISYTTKQKFPAQAEITTAKNEKNIIMLPDWYVFKELGEYKIEFSLNNSAFQPIKEVKLIQVSENKYQDKCAVDGKCAGQENKQNCPQDCVKVKKPADKIIILIIAIAIIIAIMIAAYYFLIRKKSVPAEKNER